MSAQKLLAWVQVAIGFCVLPIGLIPVGGAWANAIGDPLESEVRWALFVTWLVFVMAFWLLNNAYDALDEDADMERQELRDSQQ
jgi:type VI protein secretion system component VasK